MAKPADTCARCGRSLVSGLSKTECGDMTHPDFRAEPQVECRDRQLSNLHMLLRSVTGKLEKAHDRIEHLTTLEVGPRSANGELETLLRELDDVLEALS